jgi:hypothetical protein
MCYSLNRSHVLLYLYTLAPLLLHRFAISNVMTLRSRGLDETTSPRIRMLELLSLWHFPNMTSGH